MVERDGHSRPPLAPMNDRPQAADSGRHDSAAPGWRQTDLATFEREYTIGRLTQRDLMIDVSAAIWIMTAVSLLATGQFTDSHKSWHATVLHLALTVACVAVAVFQLTVVRRLDDQRTRQVVTGLLVILLSLHLVLSFHGPAALGSFISLLGAVSVFSAQFLGGRGASAMILLVTAFTAVLTVANYGAVYAPHLLSQMSLMIVVIWAGAYALHMFNNDRVKALDEAEHTAFADALTGLPNSRMLRRRTDALLDPRNARINRPTGLVLLDLDGFRMANTLRGHAHGDRLLVGAATALSTAATPDQLVARTGSDEFGVLVPDTDASELALLGERFRQVMLSAADALAERGVKLDASLGTALSGPGRANFDQLIDHADRELYREKALHEQGESSNRADVGRSAAAEPVPAAPVPRPTGGGSRWSRLGWSRTTTEAKFLASSWGLSGLAVAISMRMPDAPSHNALLVDVLVVFALLMAVVFYVAPPATRPLRQAFDVVLACLTLAVAIEVTGAAASPAVPIMLLILIYIGWFLPLRTVIPYTLLTFALVMAPSLMSSGSEIILLDLVWTIGGMLVMATLVVILYYNHFYVERAQALTAQLAELDPRAGAQNRRAFEQRMADELDRLSYGDRDALAVVMIDLGNFKEISAEHGRAVADRLLADVAGALTAASREEDLVARVGGDEFAIVAPGIDAESARALALRMVTAVRAATADPAEPWSGDLRPSAGFALYGMHGRTTDELMTAADVALTAAKTTGRDPERVSSYVVAL
jgi:diguanylate cyclase (GGDEF)-like protein